MSGALRVSRSTLHSGAKLHSPDWRVHAPTDRTNGSVHACATATHAPPPLAADLEYLRLSIPTINHRPLHAEALHSDMGISRWKDLKE